MRLRELKRVLGPDVEVVTKDELQQIEHVTNRKPRFRDRWFVDHNEIRKVVTAATRSRYRGGRILIVAEDRPVRKREFSQCTSEGDGADWKGRLPQIEQELVGEIGPFLVRLAAVAVMPPPKPQVPEGGAAEVAGTSP